jgi:hypothetical protein
LDQESYKPALIAWREMVRSLGKQNACREGLGVLCIRGCALFNPTSPTDGVGDAKLLKSLECSIKGLHLYGALEVKD